MELELGLDTFGDVTARDGEPLSDAQVLRDLVEQAVLAEAVGVDVIGIGEHHRADFAVSAPEMVLAAIAGRTARLKLVSAVTVLSSDDPVRVFQRFSTLDALSNGRAEMVVGRGSFTESFPLFGYALDQYERLFEEKLDLLSTLLRDDVVSWRGSVRTALERQMIHPRPEAGTLRAWVGVGGSPRSVLRAASHGLPMMLAIIGGAPARFVPHVELYRRALAEAGHDPRPVGVHSPGYVAETDLEAKEAFFADYKVMRDRIGAERGWPSMERAEFDAEVEHGSLYVGSPRTVAVKIAATARHLGLARFDLKYSAGPLSHERMMRCIELYGRAVAPLVREMLADERSSIPA